MTRIYAVMVATYDGRTNRPIHTAISQEGYETLDDAKRFIESRAGETIASKNDGWSVAKTQPGVSGWTGYTIHEITIKEAK